MNKYLTDSRIKELCSGRMSVKELSTYHPKTHTFTTRYAAHVKGVFLKTKQGLKFKTREAALKAGQKFMTGLRESV